MRAVREVLLMQDSSKRSQGPLWKQWQLLSRLWHRPRAPDHLDYHNAVRSRNDRPHREFLLPDIRLLLQLTLQLRRAVCLRASRQRLREAPQREQHMGATLRTLMAFQNKDPVLSMMLKNLP